MPSIDRQRLWHSRAMRKVKALIDRVAPTNATVLIEGERGVGKGVVAHALHAQSARRDRPLVRVNCAALPAELLETDLFGCERGGLNGAQRRKLGKFELAHEGTLFLDEVGEMAASLQAKLVRAVQYGTFARRGGDREIRVDVRVLAATHRQLAHAVAAGSFRADLFLRLSVVRIEVPALRARREQVPILAEHFLRVYSARYNRPPRGLAAETLALFLTHDWPGNVRELENVVRRVVVLEDEAGVRAELRRRGGFATGGPDRDVTHAHAARGNRAPPPPSHSVRPYRDVVEEPVPVGRRGYAGEEGAHSGPFAVASSE